MAALIDSPTTLRSLLDQYRSDLEPYVLQNIEEIKDPSAPDRRGADGYIIDLHWKGNHCVGKKLHEIFFEHGTDVKGMRYMLEKFCKEIKVMRKLTHDNIVPFWGIYYKQLQSVGVALPVLVMEKLEYSLSSYTVATRKGALRDVKITEILCDVARGLVYLHEGCSEPLAHRDLSSNNILLTSTFRAKIADFGSARVLDRPGGWNSSAKLSTMPGTQHFMPPEASENPPRYTTAMDIFSFSCVIIHLVTWEWPVPDGQLRWIKGLHDIRVCEIVSELDRRQKWISMFRKNHPLLPIVKQCLQDMDRDRPQCGQLLRSCEEVLEQCKTRNIIVVGNVGSGKSSLIKNVIGEDLAKINLSPYGSTTRSHAHVHKKLVINNNLYCCHITELPDQYRPYQLPSFHTFKRMIIADQRINLERINLIIYVIRQGRFTSEVHEVFQMYTDFFKNQYSISALVVTHCDSFSDEVRTRIVKDYKSSECTKDFTTIMGKGIYTVGFPNFDTLPDSLKECFKLSMQKDVIKLHQLIEDSSDVIDVLDDLEKRKDRFDDCPLI